MNPTAPFKKHQRILQMQRILSGMPAKFNVSGKGRRPGAMARQKILERWANPPVIGRPSFFSLGDKHQLKFDL